MRKEKQYHFIYKTTNIITQKYYIGMHSSDSLIDGYLGSGKRLRYSLNKYGKENHIREILEFCKTREELKSREYEIVNLNEIAKLECMNLRIGGECGNIHLDSTRTQISDTLKGHIVSDITRKKISVSNTGKTRSDAAKIKYSAAKLGKKASVQARKNMSIAQSGKIVSDETREKLREINTGKTHSIETRIKMSNSHIGRNYKPMSDTTKENLRLANLGKNKKVVLQYTINGDFIKEWNGIVDIVAELGIKPCSISNCIAGRKKTSHGFVWKFK